MSGKMNWARLHKVWTAGLRAACTGHSIRFQESIWRVTAMSLFFGSTGRRSKSSYLRKRRRAC